MNSIPAALVTGSSSGIGAEIARKLSATHRLVILGRSEAKLKDVLATLNQKNQPISLTIDVTKQNETDQLCEKLKDFDIHDLKLLVNNAGVFHREEFEKPAMSEWSRQFEVNLFGSVRVTHACLHMLKKYSGKTRGANIINVASTLGVKPVAMTSAYSSSKAAMLNWTQSLAQELAPAGIRVNAVSPGLVETPIHDFHQTKDKETRKQIDSMQPLGFVGQPEHVASAVCFLNSSESEWTTGSNFVVDGGISLA